MVSRLRAWNFSLVITWPGRGFGPEDAQPAHAVGQKDDRQGQKPMPPSRWVSLRQNNSPWGTTSMSVRMVAPLVV
jgi:hypothetical protein